jgi:hypothetical protein
VLRALATRRTEGPDIANPGRADVNVPTATEWEATMAATEVFVRDLDSTNPSASRKAIQRFLEKSTHGPRLWKTAPAVLAALRAWLGAPMEHVGNAPAASVEIEKYRSLETMFVEGLGMKDASPLQLAIARLADGLDPRLPKEMLLGHFGVKKLARKDEPPRIVVIVAGIRSGKSIFAGAASLRSALFADVGQALEHEMPRVAVVAPYTDLADQTFNLLAGGLMTGPLRAVVPDEPSSGKIVIQRPDGRRVEIVVVAGHRGGATLRARWLAGVVLDECALFGTKEIGSAVSAEELLAASETRLQPGAQVWIISSPYGPQGLLYEMWKQHYGERGYAGGNSDVLVVHAPTAAMNPNFARGGKSFAMVEAVRQKTPDIAAREYDAEWLDADSAWLSSKQIEDAQTAAVEEPLEDQAYAAAWDAATRGNAWTMVVGRREGQRVRVARAWQWIGSKRDPLDTGNVIREASSELARYRVRSVHCDPWSVDALRPLARQHDLSLVEHGVTQAGSVAAYRRLEVLLSSERMILLSATNDEGRMLGQDLKLVRKKTTGSGVRVELPLTADGRHCDFAPAVALLVSVLGVEAEGVRIEAGEETGLEGCREAEDPGEPEEGEAA